jgi:hypothetical protein
VALNCTIKNASANTMPVIEIMPDAIAEKIATVADGLQLDTDCGSNACSRRGSDTPAATAAVT